MSTSEASAIPAGGHVAAAHRDPRGGRSSARPDQRSATARRNNDIFIAAGGCAEWQIEGQLAKGAAGIVGERGVTCLCHEASTLGERCLQLPKSRGLLFERDRRRRDRPLALAQLGLAARERPLAARNVP